MKDTNENCNKLEGLFVFGSNEDLKEHLLSCSQCRKAYEEIMNVEKLTQASKPLYKKRKKHKQHIRVKIAACFVGVMIFGGIGTSITPSTYYSNLYDRANCKLYGISQNSQDKNANLPVDDDGILNIDKKIQDND